MPLLIEKKDTFHCIQIYIRSQQGKSFEQIRCKRSHKGLTRCEIKNTLRRKFVHKSRPKYQKTYCGARHSGDFSSQDLSEVLNTSLLNRVLLLLSCPHGYNMTWLLALYNFLVNLYSSIGQCPFTL